MGSYEDHGSWVLNHYITPIQCLTVLVTSAKAGGDVEGTGTGMPGRRAWGRGLHERGGIDAC